ncbi:hypothetical protein [Cytobacillus firmus]|uniref:Uncharacterized protein n=1 Tax=Cytobacillus firmus DS1 TaxID=1307436 RepID=W7KSW6_CYTFI|nr:hypothetical protein [Cytobacillus firmus]EWG09308.1 hypothetical protein PBF_20083 [Cytobacillus firmus DS1]
MHIIAVKKLKIPQNSLDTFWILENEGNDGLLSLYKPQQIDIELNYLDTFCIYKGYKELLTSYLEGLTV